MLLDEFCARETAAFCVLAPHEKVRLLVTEAYVHVTFAEVTFEAVVGSPYFFLSCPAVLHRELSALRESNDFLARNTLSLFLSGVQNMTWTSMEELFDNTVRPAPMTLTTRYVTNHFHARVLFLMLFRGQNLCLVAWHFRKFVEADFFAANISLRDIWDELWRDFFCPAMCCSRFHRAQINETHLARIVRETYATDDMATTNADDFVLSQLCCHARDWTGIMDGGAACMFRDYRDARLRLLQLSIAMTGWNVNDVFALPYVTDRQWEAHTVRTFLTQQLRPMPIETVLVTAITHGSAGFLRMLYADLGRSFARDVELIRARCSSPWVLLMYGRASVDSPGCRHFREPGDDAAALVHGWYAGHNADDIIARLWQFFHVEMDVFGGPDAFAAFRTCLVDMLRPLTVPLQFSITYGDWFRFGIGLRVAWNLAALSGMNAQDEHVAVIMRDVTALLSPATQVQLRCALRHIALFSSLFS